MATTHEIRRRIKSIKSTAKITKAMELVAASKLRKVETRTLSARSYEKELSLLVFKLLALGKKIDHPLLSQRPTSKTLLVVFTSNRGLAGAYNLNVIKAVLQEIEKEKEIAVIAIGKKGENFFSRAGLELKAVFHNLPTLPTMYDVKPISRLISESFLGNEVSKVKLLFTNYLSPIKQEVVSSTLLPLTLDSKESQRFLSEEEFNKLLTRYALLPPLLEPNHEEIINLLLKKIIEEKILQAFFEASTSEHAARMLAMRNATEAAEEITEELTLTYNSLRQAIITRELTEIVLGAEII